MKETVGSLASFSATSGKRCCERCHNNAAHEGHRGGVFDKEFFFDFFDNLHWGCFDCDGSDHTYAFVRFTNEGVRASGANFKDKPVVNVPGRLTRLEQAIISDGVVWQGLTAPHETDGLTLSEGDFGRAESQTRAVHGDDDIRFIRSSGTGD
tara:strand:- start:384 stop:839 length:456 start_codon:yes stop_codon:yes gene_type:complete